MECIFEVWELLDETDLSFGSPPGIPQNPLAEPLKPLIRSEPVAGPESANPFPLRRVRAANLPGFGATREMVESGFCEQFVSAGTDFLLEGRRGPVFKVNEVGHDVPSRRERLPALGQDSV